LNYKLKISPQVREFQAGLGLQHRRVVKQAIRDLAREHGDICALRDELSGCHRLKIGRHRLIFRYQTGKVIECIFIEERRLVYEMFEAEMSRIIGTE
jgi:mRNA interferase RelE/StbE